MQQLLEVLHYFFGSRIGNLLTYYLKGDEDVQWEQCKKKLAEIISLKCRGFGTVKKVINMYIVSAKCKTYTKQFGFTTILVLARNFVLQEKRNY